MSRRALRIARFDVAGFGHFADFKAQLGPGLNVLHGANEAGKSTLMAFVRQVLFGFPRKDGRERDLAPVSGGGDHGGRLWLEGPGACLEVQRLSRKGRSEGELSLFDEGGQSVSPEALGQALGGVDRELFRQVFAFTLDELQDFGSLRGQSAVSEALVVASLSGANLLPAALKTLHAELEDFGPRRHKAPLNVLLSRLDQVRQALRAAGDPPGEYRELKERIGQLGEERTRAEARRRQVQARVSALERLCQALPELTRARQAKAQLEQLPDQSPSAPSVLATAEALFTQLARATTELKAAQARSQALDARRTELLGALAGPADPAPVRVALTGLAATASTRNELPSRRAALEAKAASLGEQINALGLSGPEALPAAAGARARLSSLSAALDEAVALRASRDEALRQAAAARVELQRELEPPQPAQTGPSPDQVGQQLQAARRLGSLAAERAQVGASASSVRKSLEAASASAPPPTVARLSRGRLAAVLGALLAATGTAGAVGGTGALVAALIFSAAVAVGLWTWRRAEAAAMATSRAARRVAESERARLAAEVQGLEAQLRRLDDERAAALRLAGVERPEQAAAREQQLIDLLFEIKARQAGEQQRQQLVARLEGRAHAEAEASAAHQAAAARVDQVQAELAAVLESLGLPADTGARAALEVAAEARSLQERFEAHQLAHRALQAEAATVLAAEQALQAAGRAVLAEPLPADAAALARRLEQWLHERQALVEKVAAVEAGRAALDGPLQGQQAEREHLEQQLLATLQRAGAASLEALREQAAGANAREQLLATLREASARAEALTSVSAGDVLGLHAEALQAPDELADAAVELKALELSVQKLSADSGAAQASAQRFELDGQVATWRAEEERLKCQLGPQLQRWATARVALKLLEQARARVEEKSQPRVVQEASAMFARLTRGRYLQVLVPREGELKAPLQVRDDKGRLWPVDSLSRGTRELLFVAFRFAVILGFGAEKVALPVLLDDVLVNFDPERAAALVDELKTLAARHQVLAFTCHPHVRALLESAGARAVEVTTRAQLSLLPVDGENGAQRW